MLLLYLYQINAALVRISGYFKNIKKYIFRFVLTYIQLQLHSFHMKKEKMSNTLIFFSLFVVLMDCWPVHLRFKSVEYMSSLLLFFTICLSDVIFLYYIGIYHILSKEDCLKFVWV